MQIIFKQEQEKDKCVPLFTLKNFLDVARNDTGAIYVSIVEKNTKKSAEVYISTEHAKQRVWDVFKPESRIVGINFLDKASMRIFVMEE